MAKKTWKRGDKVRMTDDGFTEYGLSGRLVVVDSKPSTHPHYAPEVVTVRLSRSGFRDQRWIVPAQAEGGVTPTDAQLAALAALAMAATPGPWGEDDCHVFCRPMSNAREDAILAKLDGKPYNADHLDLDPFVATTEQRGEHSDADARHIAAASPDVVLAVLSALAETDSARWPLLRAALGKE